MKKNVLIIVISLLTIYGRTQEHQIENTKTLEGKIKDKTFSEFIKSFPIIELPYNSKAFDKDEYIGNLKQLPDSLTIKFVFHHDAKRTRRHYVLYDMTTNQPTEGDDHVTINPVFKLPIDNYFLLCYGILHEGDDGYPVRLVSYDVTGTIVDSIEIYNILGRTEYYTYAASYIDRHLNINVFRYKVNEGKNKSGYRTVLTISKFIFNNKTGKFENEGKEEVKFIKCSVDDIVTKAKKCVEDPMNMLP